MNVIVYSKENCSYCVSAKEFLRSNGVAFSEVKIGQDIVVEEFKEQYPEQSTVPLVIIDGVKVGGYAELREWWDGRPQLLVE